MAFLFTLGVFARNLELSDLGCHIFFGSIIHAYNFSSNNLYALIFVLLKTIR